METKVQLNGIRLAPRKVRAVANLLKRKNVTDALDQMENLVKRPTLPLSKLIKGAIANAENNFSMVKENLYIKDLIVNEGPKLRRIRPSAYGVAKQIQKKTSRIMLILEERVPGLKRKDQAKTGQSLAGAKSSSSKAESKKPEVQREVGNKPVAAPLAKKKMFQRKSI